MNTTDGRSRELINYTWPLTEFKERDDVGEPEQIGARVEVHGGFLDAFVIFIRSTLAESSLNVHDKRINKYDAN